jgi:phosphoglucosamine mutase
MTSRARFGTDGLRGKAGEPPLDRATLGRVGSAIGIWLRGSGGARSKKVLLGHDGRASANWILRALAQGLSTVDVACADVGLTTTPALAFLVRTEPFAAGVMISASHNPAHDNGVKIFARGGGKLPDEAERLIEELVEEVGPAPMSDPPLRRRPKLLRRYEQHLAEVFATLDLSGTKIVIDGANGGGSELAPRILKEFGATVVEVACEPDGTNINAGVGALHADRLAPVVTSERAALGICLDGDGDRAIFVDEQGVVRDGDETLAVLGRHFAKGGRLASDTVVATVMSNLGLRRFLEDCGVQMVTTPVGDRHVVQAMREGGYVLGGEQSGHIVFAGSGHFTGDGLFTALQLLSVPGALEGSMSSLFADFVRYPQILLNVPVTRKPALESLPQVQAAVTRAEQALAGDGRVLLRYSGTENLCRVMVEGPEQKVIEQHARELAETVQRELSA